MQATCTTTNLSYLNEKTEASESVRAVQNAFLSELPGVTFAFLTLAYVITAFIGL